jgi:hypothetical protein
MIANDITALDDLQAEALDLGRAYMTFASAIADRQVKMRLYNCAAALMSVAYATREQSNVLLARSVS